MNPVDYRAYIQSDDWKHRRAAALRRVARPVSQHVRWSVPRCEVCGTFGTQHKNRAEPKERQFRVEWSNGLEVHHLHYRSLGQEEPEDLIVLCWDCHKRTHNDRAFKQEVARVAGDRW